MTASAYYIGLAAITVLADDVQEEVKSEAGDKSLNNLKQLVLFSIGEKRFVIASLTQNKKEEQNEDCQKDQPRKSGGEARQGG